MRTCIEGCGNILTPADASRFPESLSRPLPDVQQGVENNDIAILNMRLRCRNCYNRSYNKKYYAISYRWSHEDRNRSFATVTVHDETTRTRRPGVHIPIRSKGQRSVIMRCGLFFLDVLNSSSGSGQWYTSNLWRTYTSCKGMKILLGASDHELLEGIREEALHQSGITRDRDGYLRAMYGKQERASAYMQLPPGDIRFYSMYGRDMGNIEQQGLVPQSDNVYRDMLENKSHLLYGSGNTRAGGAAIAKTFTTRSQQPEETARSSRRILTLEHYQESTLDVNGCLATQAPAYETPGLMPAILDTVFDDPPLGEPTTYGSERSLDVIPLNSSLNIPDIGGYTSEYDIEAPLIPSPYDTSLDLTCMNGSAELFASGINLPSLATHTFLSSTGVGETSSASITDKMSGITISSETGQSSECHHVDYMIGR